MATTATATWTAAPARANDDGRDQSGGAVEGGVRLVLRLEALALFAVAIVLYARFGAGWRLFALLFLAPDLSFLGYLAGARLGAVAYNAAHSLIGPLLVAIVGLALPGPALALALIWVAHIELDRALGYGLKYQTGFGATHLGRLGRAGR
jgi:Domain of unknown function (DUF4260)